MQLGLAHTLLLSYDREHCEAINQIVPDVGCVWSSDLTPPDMIGNFHLWNMRYRMAARRAFLDPSHNKTCQLQHMLDTFTAGIDSLDHSPC